MTKFPSLTKSHMTKEKIKHTPTVFCYTLRLLDNYIQLCIYIKSIVKISDVTTTYSIFKQLLNG